MASRERRRAERSKRKARSADRRAQIGARYEERNRAAREVLEPLSEDERPAVVTAGAVIAGLIGASVVIAYLAGATVDGERPAILQVIPPAALMGVMPFGMWRVRYWAVLGFQAVLALLILAAALGLVGAESAARAGRQPGADRNRGHPLLLHDQGLGPHPDARARPARVGGAVPVLEVVSELPSLRPPPPDVRAGVLRQPLIESKGWPIPTT